MKRILITGAEGFIGKNIALHIDFRDDLEMIPFSRQNRPEELPTLLNDVDFVVHLAGINRPQDPAEFTRGNVDLTKSLCDALADEAAVSGRQIPVIYASSTQAANDNEYGRSKQEAEVLLSELSQSHAIPVHIFRLPNVFGKWCRPNYNSAVATFCYNISHDLPITINDPNAPLTLVYIDDVVASFLSLINGGECPADSDGFTQALPQYSTTVGAVADCLHGFKNSRETLVVEGMGTGLTRALHATYLSYLEPDQFSYGLTKHGDERGIFVEMLKTPDCGQMSFFTAHPGITRGGHYHHTKTEKFLVVKGSARFKFRHMLSGQTHSIETNGEVPEIVETVPGWAHDITNIGNEEMVVMLWANELFDPENPDTYASKL